MASIYHVKPSPKQQDWVDSYKADNELSLLWHHLSDKSLPVPSSIVSTVDRCYCAHLREDRIKLEHGKLVCYVPIGGNKRFVTLLLVPKALTRMVFAAYHASGIGGHVGINKTLLVLRLRFLWPNMRLQIMA